MVCRHSLLVQVGSEGNLLVWKEGEALIPEIAVHTVDTTGAGDAFAAALAVSEAEGVAFGEAGWFATAAALATTAVGAQAGLPRRQAVLDLLETVRFDSVPLAERSLDRHW
jgi:ribokinase